MDFHFAFLQKNCSQTAYLSRLRAKYLFPAEGCLCIEKRFDFLFTFGTLEPVGIRTPWAQMPTAIQSPSPAFSVLSTLRNLFGKILFYPHFCNLI